MSRAATGTVEYRGNPARWFARVTTRTPEGAIVRPWVDLERPDLRNTPGDKSAAKRLAVKRAKLAAKGVYVGPDAAPAPTRTTVEELGERWFELLRKDPDLKPASVSRMKTSWATIQKQLGPRPVVELTGSGGPAALRAWILQRRADRSASTTRNDVLALTRFFKDSIAQGWIPKTANPMKDDYVREAIPPMDTPEPDEIVNFSKPEAEKLLGSSLSDIHFGMLLISAANGLRDGELHGLRFSDIGVDEKYPEIVRFYILRQALLARDGEPVQLGSTKSGSGRRKAPIHTSVLRWLMWWFSEGWAQHVGRAPEAGDFIFPDTSGGIWRPRAADLLRDLLTEAGLATTFTTPDGDELPYTWHALRRTFSSLLADAGVRGEIADYLLGHAPPSTRGRHYQAPPMSELARAIATVELALPARDGVSSSTTSGRESSRESSYGETRPDSKKEKPSQTRVLGGVAEWSKAAVLKTADGASCPGVRIPSPPPRRPSSLRRCR